MQRKWQQTGTKKTSEDRYTFSNDDVDLFNFYIELTLCWKGSVKAKRDAVYYDAKQTNAVQSMCINGSVENLDASKVIEHSPCAFNNIYLGRTLAQSKVT